MAACAAYISVSASNMDDGWLQDAIIADAKWYADMARAYAKKVYNTLSESAWDDLGIENAEEFANMMMTIATQGIQDKYNDGTYTWDSIVDYAQQCSAAKSNYE